MAEVERLGDLVHVAFIKQQFGAHLVLEGSPKQGNALLQESLQLVRDLDFQRFEPFILDDLAIAAYRLGDYERAEALSLEHLASAARLGMETSTRDAWWILGRAATVRGDVSTAHAHLVRGLQFSRMRSSAMHKLVLLLPFIHLAVARGDVARAAELVGVVRSRLLQHGEAHVLEARLRPFVAAELDELLETLRGRMDVDELAALLEQGSGTSLEDAVSAILTE